MNPPRAEPDEDWPRDADDHRRQQLRRAAALPFAEKLQWLEEAHMLAETFAAARRRSAEPSRPDLSATRASD